MYVSIKKQTINMLQTPSKIEFEKNYQNIHNVPVFWSHFKFGFELPFSFFSLSLSLSIFVSVII